jgi:RimJ/RimL family protein N-acetyltransferase
MSEFTVKYLGSIEADSDYQPKAELEVSFAESIGGLIFDANHEFIPHLSYRRGSIGSSSLKNRKNLRGPGIEDYTQQMLSQKNILVFNKENEVVAFMSFRHDYEERSYLLRFLDEGDKINYLTTLIVRKDYRGKGLMKTLYDYIEKKLPESVHANIVATRTWVGNDSHIRYLEKNGYQVACTLHKEREFEGDFYDTVYYCKRLDREQVNKRRQY